jgi:hypothetical protein
MKDEYWNYLLSKRRKMTPLTKAQEQLNSCGVPTKIENESLYVCVENLELEVSEFEIKFRADLFDEQS